MSCWIFLSEAVYRTSTGWWMINHDSQTDTSSLSLASSPSIHNGVTRNISVSLVLQHYRWNKIRNQKFQFETESRSNHICQKLFCVRISLEKKKKILMVMPVISKPAGQWFYFGSPKSVCLIFCISDFSLQLESCFLYCLTAMLWTFLTAQGSRSFQYTENM